MTSAKKDEQSISVVFLDEIKQQQQVARRILPALVTHVKAPRTPLQPSPCHLLYLTLLLWGLAMSEPLVSLASHPVLLTYF